MVVSMLSKCMTEQDGPKAKVFQKTVEYPENWRNHARAGEL